MFPEREQRQTLRCPDLRLSPGVCGLGQADRLLRAGGKHVRDGAAGDRGAGRRDERKDYSARFVIAHRR